ncbi:F-box/kelch-repeat protein [Quillaja saponaria]|uniref:F-box/kelch-repeat protein n=1 Tax=Quillaja saponaria TaxID=32244 RepID=A0AAD7QES1_QUISA|nr:F-box/kelch-repeat protein [Quillaja saponaria]
MARECDQDNDAGMTRRVALTTGKRQRLIFGSDESLTPPSLSSSRQQNQNGDQQPLAVRETNVPSHDTPILPQELIEEILSRLPVKILVKFRCVCKSWKSLISDPQFIKDHLRISAMDTKFANHSIILTTARHKFRIQSYSVSSVFNNSSARVVELKSRRCYEWMCGSCNGILCFAIKQDSVRLWNPSIRVSKKLPCLDNGVRKGSFTVFGFGYDHLNDDYKVVAVFCYLDTGNSYKNVVKVCTLRTNSWKRIGEFPYRFPYDESGKFVPGSLNWVANSNPGSGSLCAIVSLDLGKEIYREILQPDCKEALDLKPTLGVLRDCLCISYDDSSASHTVVWLMNQYGVKDSWTKLLTIPHLRSPEYVELEHNPLCISENGDVLMQLESGVVLYNSRNNTFKYPEIENYNIWLDVEVYVESLVSPRY